MAPPAEGVLLVLIPNEFTLSEGQQVSHWLLQQKSTT